MTGKIKTHTELSVHTSRHMYQFIYPVFCSI